MTLEQKREAAQLRQEAYSLLSLEEKKARHLRLNLALSKAGKPSGGVKVWKKLTSTPASSSPSPAL